MKKIITGFSMALLGAGITYTVMRSKPETPLPAENRSAVSAPTDARIKALTGEVAELKARLAAKSESAPPASEIKADKEEAAADTIARLRETMMAKRREALPAQVKAKVERLTEKFSLSPEQASAATAWHQSHQEAILAADMKSPPDPGDYHLRMAYREDLPPEVRSALTPEQREVWEKYDSDSRADSVESITNGEMGYIASTLDLSRDQKDQLFPLLAQIYMEDTHDDFADVVDIESLSARKDSDNGRRREIYGKIFDAKQLEKWESIAASYKGGMLQQYNPVRK